ncbi:AraC family transcriptional regulator [Sagittula sp. NFXS13]|uniref:helix-turn-helix domain-containing protein n=1 Tax=Sagittula sp. NFXS13 TaxID=2819095 RepID=UPI0032E0347D
MSRPGFLKNPMPPAPAKTRGAIRAGSFMPELQAAPWRYHLAHDREDVTLLWITKGQGRAVVNGVRRGLSTHIALWLPARTLFSIELQPGTQALFVQAPAGLAPQEPQAPVLLRIRDGYGQAELTGEIDTMHRELHAKRPLMQDALEARAALIGIWLHRQIEAGAADAPQPTAAQRLVQRYAADLTRHFRTPRSMGSYAEALDVTATHLTRCCRACCGKTAADLLAERRLHAARIALESPKPPVQDVAKSLGFSSPAYFARFIQNHTGVSPTELRRAGRKPATLRSTF